MKGYEGKRVRAFEFEANGRTVILKPLSEPYEDEGTWFFVGFRWQWFKNDFAKKSVRLSAKKFQEIMWTY